MMTELILEFRYFRDSRLVKCSLTFPYSEVGGRSLSQAALVWEVKDNNAAIKMGMVQKEPTAWGRLQTCRARNRPAGCEPAPRCLLPQHRTSWSIPQTGNAL